MRTLTQFLLLSLVLVAGTNCLAQSTESMLKDWERAKAYTMEYLEAMPADKFDFKPTQEIRSFAQQALHLTDANYGFASAASGTESPVAFGDSEKAQDTSKENVTKLVTEGYDFVINSLKGISDEQLTEPVTLFGKFEMTKGEAYQKAFEHQTHHRGQTTVYLRLAGATPPGEKLF